MLPNTIIVGVQKAATSTIFDWLSQHPDVFGNSAMKDYNFFMNQDNLNFGINWFESSFKKNNGEKICLHGYVKYINNIRAVIENTERYCNNCRYIVSIREPVERAYSGYWEGRKTTRIKSKSFEDEVFIRSTSQEPIEINENSLCIRESLYYEDIKCLIECVGRDRVKVVNFQDIKRKPKETLIDLFEFLQIDSSFCPNLKKVNESGLPRSVLLQKFFQKIRAPGIFKKYIGASNLSKFKSFLIRKVNVKRVRYPTIENETKRKLSLYFEEDQKKLQRLLNEFYSS